MFHCPKCHYAAHARTSRYFSDTTKERYHQCTNINCSCTFVTTEPLSVSSFRRGSRTGSTAPDDDRSASNALAVSQKKSPAIAGLSLSMWSMCGRDQK